MQSHLADFRLPVSGVTVLDFFRELTTADLDVIAQRIADDGGLAVRGAPAGATRKESVPFFLESIAHYVYAGDTALHVAAAAFRRDVAALLIAHGAVVRALNRRGAEPLHYAADTNRWAPEAQAATIEYLLSAGADPNALDGSGVSPLHRAVRTRSAAAVRALLDGGADPHRRNRSGSTPLHLARQSTGRGGSGSALAHAQQTAIVALLIDRGAAD